MDKLHYSKRLKKYGRDDQKTNSTEQTLNRIMIAVAVIVVAFIIFLEVRHCIALDDAALNMTQQEWNACGGDYWWTE